MKNLRVVFGIIRKYCVETGISNGQCFWELEHLALNRSLVFPLFSYLRVLESLGIIKLSKFRKSIVLTEKGKVADNGSISGPWPAFVLSLHVLRRLFIVLFLLALFWPALLMMQKRQNEQEEKNSAG